jgi:hypothetical protein
MGRWPHAQGYPCLSTSAPRVSGTATIPYIYVNKGLGQNSRTQGVSLDVKIYGFLGFAGVPPTDVFPFSNCSVTLLV